MKVLTPGRLGQWTRGLGLIALAALAWAALASGDFFWPAVMAASLVGAAVATTFLVRHQRAPSLAQVIAGAEAEPVLTPGRERRH